MSNPLSYPTREKAPQITPEEFMNKSTEMICSCGSKFFIEAFGIRKASRIAFPQLSRDAVQPIPVFVCMKCHKELKLNEL